MSNATKSIILFFGISAFFGIMVLGPVVGGLVDRAVAWGASLSTGVTPLTVEKQRAYAGTPMAHALTCCTLNCESDWDFRRDLCDPGSQVANACLLACVEAPPEAPKAAAAH